MTIDCCFVEFHSPVFIQGKNFGTKVDIKSTPGVKLWYDLDLRLMFMSYKGKNHFFDSFHSAEPMNKVEDKNIVPVGAVRLKKAKANEATQGE